METDEPPEPSSSSSPSPPLPPDRRPSYWPLILCLLGVDYFSTLSYQPSITFQVAGTLGPLATAAVVLVMLIGVLPVYFHIVKRSPHGQGSIALIEGLIQGWIGKTLVLILLGFAVTDFVMLKAISVADAAEHVLHNSLVAEHGHLTVLADHGKQLSRRLVHSEWAEYFDDQLVVTIFLGLLGFAFWFLLRKGFNRKAILVSVPLVVMYVAVNGLVIAGGLWYLMHHPWLIAEWWNNLGTSDAPPTSMLDFAAQGLPIAVACIVLLPKLALGLSGFELSLIVAPTVKGDDGDTEENPKGRIRNARKLLIWAACIMSVLLLSGVFVTTILIPQAEMGPTGDAHNRALAYLAHGGTLSDHAAGARLNPIFGTAFGTLYDISTVLVLCFAGTSVMVALAILLPRFLLRFGMELKWADRWGVLFVIFTLINVTIILIYRADVEQQRSAYATGVLGLIVSAAVASAMYRLPKKPAGRWWRRVPWKTAFFALLIFVMWIAVIIDSPGGLLIACLFIFAILGTAVVSRALRTDELRTIGFEFADDHSKFLWDTLRVTEFPVLVPHRPGRHIRENKETTVRQDHQLAPDAEIVFIEVEVDDPSNFYQRLKIRIFQDGKNFVIKVTQCVSVAHAIAAIAMELSKHGKPPGLHFGWSETDLMAASWSYFAFGEGNVPWKVRELLIHAESDREKLPRVVIG